MKKSLFVIVASVLLLVGCSMPTIEAGKVGVIHEKPLIFGKGGIMTDRVVPTGTREMFALTTSVELLGNVPQTFTVHTDDVMSSNKVPLDFDVAITVAPANDLCVAKMYKTYGLGPVGTFARHVMPDLDLVRMHAQNPSGEFMSYFRDGVRQHHMDEYIIGQTPDGKQSDAITVLEKGLGENINKFLAQKTDGCIVITNVSIGRANPPDEVKGALARTAEQVQLAKTEKERKIAQDARKESEEASAAADKAQQTKLGFSNAEYLKKLELETILKVCGNSTKELRDNASGRANCTLIVGASSQVVPTVSVK